MSMPPSMPLKILSGTDQKLTAGASSALAAAFGAQTRAIRISVTGTAGVRIAIGPGANPGPVATANSYVIKQTDISLDIGITPGDRLAYIQDAAGGILNIVELSA